MKLSKEYYQQDDVVFLAKDLLGKHIFTNIDGEYCEARIVETEAYKAPEDKASHAFNYKKTERTAVFYLPGGISYVYMCYGIHYLFNIITNKAEVPNAILIRAVEPIEGLEVMSKRRGKKPTDYTLTSGPGALSAALGITKKHNGLDLTKTTIWIEDKGIFVPEEDVIASPRVGIAYAGEEWANKPWRFRIKNNPWTSRAK